MLCNVVPTHADLVYEPCSPGEPGSMEASLQYFADNNLADKVGVV